MVSVALGREAPGPEMDPGMDPGMGVGKRPAIQGPFTLRVSGAKPLRLKGTLLVEGHSRDADCAAWHEVAIWQLAGHDVAVALRTHRRADAEAAVHRAELFPILAEALDWLEDYDPVADLAVDFDASDRRLSAVEVALRAAALRGRADEVTRQWRALLGELLFVLDAEEAASLAEA